jgi:hypothetical protein
MLALLSLVGLVFSLTQFVRSSCAEPPATKATVIEAMRQELQRCEEEAAAATTASSIKRRAQRPCDADVDAMHLTAER